MIFLSLITINLMSAIMFTQMNHPLAMTLLILTQTLLICLTTGVISQSFWFSYILFLVFLGGMLVLFIYITSLASNEMFSIPIKVIFIVSTLASSVILSSMIIDPTPVMTLINNMDILKISSPLNHLHNESVLSLTKLYNNPTQFITLTLALYLFLTLIAIVKLTNIFQGPLRHKN